MPLNNTLTQTLQALERGRQAAHDKQQKEEAIKIEAAASAVQSALDSASILIKNRELERRLEAQNKKLLGLKIELDSASLVVEEEKRKCHKAWQNTGKIISFLVDVIWKQADRRRAGQKGAG